MPHVFVLGGRTIGLQALDPQLDWLFEQLHAAYYGNLPLAWDDLAAAAATYFGNHVNDWAAHDAYFNDFTVIWKDLLTGGRHELAAQLWVRAIATATSWEQASGQRIHKGTPYYFFAMTTLLRGDIDTGYLLAHQAFQEDVQSTGRPNPDLPGYALVSLNYDRVDQAFRDWVNAQAQFLDARLTRYNSTYQRTVTLADVQRRFLRQPPTSDTLFLFTYTIARLMSVNSVPEQTRRNPFAGQLEINILFDLTLVIDAAIKVKDNHRYFIDHAAHVLAAAGCPLRTQPDLGEINGHFIADFDGTVIAGLDGTLAVPAAQLTRFQCDVALAYGIRNFGAHNTGSPPTIYNRFEEFHQALFNVLFATIEHLY